MSFSGGMRTSPNGLGLIKVYEGFVDTIYLDAVGKATIGYGHLLTAADKATDRWDNGTDPVYGKANGGPSAISQDDATSLLAQDVSSAEDAVNSLVEVDLNQNQFDALVDLVYNIGRSNFASSSLLRSLNAGDFDGAANGFATWNKGHDPSGALVVLDGLTRRRTKEAALFQKDPSDSSQETYASGDDDSGFLGSMTTTKWIAMGAGLLLGGYLLLRR